MEIMEISMCIQLMWGEEFERDLQVFDKNLANNFKISNKSRRIFLQKFGDIEN
jgi:hypothetical protein